MRIDLVHRQHLIPSGEGGAASSQLAEIKCEGASIIAPGEPRQITVRRNRGRTGKLVPRRRRSSTQHQAAAGYHVEWGGQFEIWSGLGNGYRDSSITIAIILFFSSLCSLQVYAGW